MLSKATSFFEACASLSYGVLRGSSPPPLHMCKQSIIYGRFPLEPILKRGRKLDIRVGDSLDVGSERFKFVTISIVSFTTFFFYFPFVLGAH